MILVNKGCYSAKLRNYWKLGNTRIRTAHLLPPVAVNTRETFLLGSYLMLLNIQMPTKLGRRTRSMYLRQLDETTMSSLLEDRHGVLITYFETSVLDVALNIYVKVQKCFSGVL